MSAGKSTDAVIGFEIKLVDQNLLNKLVSEAVKTYELEYRQEINALKAEELLEIKSSQEFIYAKYDDLKSKHDKLQKVNKTQEEIKKLKAQSVELEGRGVQKEEKN